MDKEKKGANREIAAKEILEKAKKAGATTATEIRMWMKGAGASDSQINPIMKFYVEEPSKPKPENIQKPAEPDSVEKKKIWQSHKEPFSQIKFSDLDYEKLKQLRNYSNVIRFFWLFWLSLTILQIVIILTMLNNSEPAIILTHAVFMGFTAFGAYGFSKRAPWARVIGVIHSYVMLIGFPIGTFVGVLGIRAFTGGKILFGENKYQHGYLGNEFQHRKKNKIFQ